MDPNGNPQRPLKEKKVKVPAKISLTTNSKLDVATEPGLPGAFAIIVTNGQQTFQLTVHHPIGFTDLSDESWVATPSSEINSLLTRVTDTSVKNVEKQRREALTAHLLAKNVLSKNASGEIVYPGTSTVRNDRKSEIDKSFTEARKQALEEAKSSAAAQGQKFVENKWKPGFSRESFLKDDEVRFEAAILKETLAIKPEIEKKYPINFRTLAGPLANRAQANCGIAPTGTTAQAMDFAIRKIVQSMKAVEVTPVTPTAPTGAPPTGAPPTGTPPSAPQGTR